MTRIFIENNELELTADMSNQLTYSVDDIKKIDSKATSFSKTIVIAGTNRNNQIFGNIFELAHANLTDPLQDNVYYNFDASKAAQARIEINGMKVMQGVLRLLSITIEKGQIEYEVAIFGELGGFISNIAVKKLEDIDFSIYNHQWNIQEIIGSWEQQPTYTSLTYYDFDGPYSSITTPPYDFFRIEIDVLCTRFSIGDTIQVNGSSNNDGVYVIEEIFFINGSTRIHIKQTTAQLSTFVPENGGGGLVIQALKDWGVGYVYPLIDYGVAYPTGFPKDQDFRHFRPALFVREYMDRIIKDAGYSYESNFFDTPFFRSLIIPNNDIGLEKRGLNYFVDVYVANNSDNTFTQFGAFNKKYAYNNVLSLNNFTSPNNEDFVYVGASLTNVKITAYIDVYVLLAGNTHLTYSLIRKRSNTETTLGTITHPNNSSQGMGARGNYSAKIEISTAIQPNDVIYLRVNTWQPNGYATPATHEDTRLNSYLKIEQDPAGFIQYTYNELLEMNKLIPRNVYQKDFFLSIVKMFNLMIVEDKMIDKRLKIEPYIDFYQTDRSTYLDWSYKVNRESAMKIVPMSETNSRIYEFKYKEDNDYYNEFYKKKFNELYGNRVYDNRLEFSKDSSSVDVIFSPTILVGYDDEDKVISTIYKYDEGTQIKKPQAHNIRILQIRKIQVEPYGIYNDASPLASPDHYLYAGHLDDPNIPSIDINWGAVQQLFYDTSPTGSYQYNLFYNFYSPYMAEIADKDSRLFTCDMYLTEQDINDLDFSRYVLVDGVLFRLVKVQDWSEGELCKVSLLRVINSKYYPEAPITSNALILRFADITLTDTMLGGNRYDVTKWSTFFSTQFHRVIIYGEYVYLYTTEIFKIPKSRFSGDTNITEIHDNIGCIDIVDDDAFKSATELRIAHFESVNKIESAAFIDCNNMYSFSAPKCVSVENQCFAECLSLTYLDLSNLGNSYDQFGNQYQDFCGQDLSNNKVFENIIGNNVEFKLHNAAYYGVFGVGNDQDIYAFLAANQVNLILIN
jgi:hypothetical protein